MENIFCIATTFIWMYVYIDIQTKMKRQFNSNDEEGVCPRCGEYGCLEYDCEDYGLDGGYLIFPFVCENCGFKGEELNSLVFEENREACCCAAEGAR